MSWKNVLLEVEGCVPQCPIAGDANAFVRLWQMSTALAHKHCDDTSLKDEVERHWREIIKHSYRFEQQQTEVCRVKSTHKVHRVCKQSTVAVGLIWIMNLTVELTSLQLKDKATQSDEWWDWKQKLLTQKWFEIAVRPNILRPCCQSVLLAWHCMHCIVLYCFTFTQSATFWFLSELESKIDCECKSIQFSLCLSHQSLTSGPRCSGGSKRSQG